MSGMGLLLVAAAHRSGSRHRGFGQAPNVWSEMTHLGWLEKAQFGLSPSSRRLAIFKLCRRVTKSEVPLARATLIIAAYRRALEFYALLARAKRRRCRKCKTA